VTLIIGDKITVIDTGVKGSEKIIFDYLQKQKRDATEIDAIILSQAHPDHFGSAARIKK
jgi:glyoxylase-like metal-dependent hydrolase (beta-lactamase superfamily II)